MRLWPTYQVSVLGVVWLAAAASASAPTTSSPTPTSAESCSGVSCGAHCSGFACARRCIGANCADGCDGGECGLACTGADCATGCNGILCGSNCVGADCANGCVGDNCGTACNGASCGAGCDGEECAADCEHVMCANLCTGDECGIRCGGANCAEGCNGTRCGLGCIGVTCATRCAGLRCGADCNGANCATECVGCQCAANCTGFECGSLCQGAECAADCQTTGCAIGCIGDFCDCAGTACPSTLPSTAPTTAPTRTPTDSPTLVPSVTAVSPTALPTLASPTTSLGNEQGTFTVSSSAAGSYTTICLTYEPGTIRSQDAADVAASITSTPLTVGTSASNNAVETCSNGVFTYITLVPTATPTVAPQSSAPTPSPSRSTTTVPPVESPGLVQDSPTSSPTPAAPPSTNVPTSTPVASPTESPTSSLTASPTSPTDGPTAVPSASTPTSNPVASPTESPTSSLTASPTSPTDGPTELPSTSTPTSNPIGQPTESPTTSSNANPTSPTDRPTISPSSLPLTSSPIASSTQSPTTFVTATPTSPTYVLTSSPSMISPTSNPTPSSSLPTTTLVTTRPTLTTDFATASPTSNPVASPTGPTVFVTTSPGLSMFAPAASPFSVPTSRPTKVPTSVPVSHGTNTTSPTAQQMASIPTSAPSEIRTTLATTTIADTPGQPSVAPIYSTPMPSMEPSGVGAVPSIAPNWGPVSTAAPHFVAVSPPATPPTSANAPTPVVLSATALEQIEIFDVAEQSGFTPESVDAATAILFDHTVADLPVDADVLNATLAFLGKYADSVRTTASDATLTVESRRNNTSAFVDRIAMVASLLSMNLLLSASAGRIVTASLLQGARSLETLQEVSCGTPTSSIALPVSQSIRAGYIRAFELSASTSDTVAMYPEDVPVDFSDYSEFSDDTWEASGDADTEVVQSVSDFRIKLSAAVPIPTGGASPCGVTTIVVAASIVEFVDDALFPSSSTARVHGTTARIGSAVLSASLSESVNDLPNGDRISGTYDYKKNLDADPTWLGSVDDYDKTSFPKYATPKCVFFDHEKEQWSQDGCEMTFRNSTHATCLCNHLASFAIMVSAEEVSEEEGITLEAYTYIGVGFTLFLLVVTATVAATTPTLRSQPLQTRILFNMVAAMAGAELLLVAIVRPSIDTDSCEVASATLLFAVLSSFAWMNVEGYHLYRLVSVDTVSDAATHTGMLQWYAAFAVGLPLVITLAATSDRDAMISMLDVTITATGEVVHSDIGYCFFDNDSVAKWFLFGPLTLLVPSTIGLAIGVIHVGQLDFKRWRDGPLNRQDTQVQDAVLLLLVVITTCISWGLASMILFDVDLPGAQYGFTLVVVFQGCSICGLHALRKDPLRGHILALLSHHGCCPGLGHRDLYHRGSKLARPATRSLAPSNRPTIADLYCGQTIASPTESRRSRSYLEAVLAQPGSSCNNLTDFEEGVYDQAASLFHLPPTVGGSSEVDSRTAGGGSGELVLYENEEDGIDADYIYEDELVTGSFSSSTVSGELNTDPPRASTPLDFVNDGGIGSGYICGDELGVCETDEATSGTATSDSSRTATESDVVNLVAEEDYEKRIATNRTQ